MLAMQRGACHPSPRECHVYLQRAMQGPTSEGWTLCLKHNPRTCSRLQAQRAQITERRACGPLVRRKVASHARLHACVPLQGEASAP